MAKTTYGQTWWGKQWLNALSNIDNSNRLPRGKTYANKGAVKDFSVSSKGIEAKVQGSMPRPYRQQLGLAAFTTEEKERIIGCIEENPVLIAELLNRKMPAELNEVLNNAGISLFPKTWKSLTMSCSCPDYAVPCKHLAAVIYVVANEIDRNPFLLFEMRGFDLMSELKKRNIVSSKETKEKIYSFSDFYEKKKQKKKGNFSKDAYEALSFAPYNNNLSKLLRLLSDENLFFKGADFKVLLKKIYKQAAKSLQKALPSNLTEEEATLKNFQNCDLIELQLNEDGNFSSICFVERNSDDTQEIFFGKAHHAVAELISLILRTERADIWLYPPQWIALHSIYRFAENLLESENYMPRLLETANGFIVQWIPADINPEVKKMMKDLEDFLPANMLCIYDAAEEDYFHLQKAETIRNICSIFLNYWVHDGAKALWREYDKENAAVAILFTSNEPQTFKGLGEAEIPTSIQLWLRKFYLQHKRFVPLIRVEEGKRDDFELSIQVEDREEEMSLPINWEKFVNSKEFEPFRMDLLRDLQLLSEYLPNISKLIKAKNAEKCLYYNGSAFEKIFFEALPIMELLGIRVLLPKSLRSLLFPQLSMSIKKDGKEKGKSFLQLQQMLGFDWAVAIGDTQLTPEEFKELVKKQSGLVKLRDQYVHLDKEALQKLLKQLESATKPTAAELMQAALSGRFNGAKVLMDNEAQKMIEELRQVKEVPLPQGLQATLRPYQHNGFSWMYKNAQLGMGSLLADDMGLGKTLQVITLLLKFKQEGIFEKKKAMVAVPTTLLSNWMREIAKFAPELKAAVYHGTQRTIPNDFEVLITTYGVLRSEVKVLSKYNWFIMTIDEAQNIKNVTTAQTKAVKSIKADIYVAMSGTPVENRMSEYWSIMDFANKGYLGSLSKFTTNFADPIQKHNDKQALESFRMITAPFILRRMKSDKSIIQDLPEKVENDYLVNLEPEQAAAYENLVLNALKDIEKSEGIARKGLVLTMMMALKQICNHPYQYLKKGIKTPEASGKANMLFDLLDNIRSQQEKVLIFTQYKQMGDLLVEWIRLRYGREPLFLHGGTTRSKRDEFVQTFQTSYQDNIFILSLKAGGTGLNLTGANHVIHYDLWWNPAVEAQATDRAYRIGQQKNVMVYRLLSNGTMEERIDAMIKGKKELANLTVATGETWMGDLSNDELRNLVALSVNTGG